MLLDKIDEKSISELCDEHSDQTEFQPEKYDIFFQYDTAGGAMIYLAVLKNLADSTLPLGYYFSIGADLTVYFEDEFPWLPLLTYLRTYERELSEERQKELYGEAFYTLGAVAGMSAKELAERETARLSFLSFLDRLEGKGLLNAEAQKEKAFRLQFELMELPDKTKPIAFRLKIGQSGGKLYYVQNAQKFCQALKTGCELSVRKNLSVYLSPDAFEEPWRPVMNHFLDYLHPSKAAGCSQYFLVSRDQIPAFISLLPDDAAGDVVVSDQGPWTITEEKTPASVSLDAEGSLLLTPSISVRKEKQEYVISDRWMVLFYLEKRRIVLYHFDTSVNAELFSYFTGRTRKEIAYVSDLIAKRILPVSTGIIRKSKGDHAFRISVYISLEGNALLFRTEYLVGDESKELSYFEGKTIEQAFIRSYASVIQSLHGVTNGKVEESDDILFFLQSDLEPLRQVASVYLDEKLKRLKVRKAPSVQIRAARVKGWLNLSFHSDEFSAEELEKIYAAYRRKKTYFLLKDNLILLEPEKMAPVEEIIEEAGAEKSLSEVVLPFYHVMKLEGYKEAGADISMDRWVKDAVTEVVDYKNEALSLSESLEKTLRPYQADGVRWMRKLSKYGFSGILADDMGLGKTLEVLTFLASSGFEKPVLIVCPKSLVYNWRNEIMKWLGDIPVVIVAGTKSARLDLIRSIPEKGRVLYITGYDSLRTDIDSYEEKPFSLVLADEAQNVKNASTQKAKALRKIKSDMRLALTGTPVENSLTDLWSIFDFLMPGYLGTEADFRKKYEAEDNQAVARVVLARKVSPFLLRRSKEEVLDSLPGKEVILVTVSMADEQRRLYEAYLYKARELASKEKGVSVLAALTRLRQICVDPSVFLEDYEETSAKLSVALEQVKDGIGGGHRILVFSAFTRVLEHFRYYLEENDIRSYYISGETPGSLRVEMAEKFNTESRVKVMLISVKAGGTGLNLVGADTVIHLDPWWNFAVEEQATDRAYRIGQTKPVTVYKLIAHDSIEEKVIALQEKKRQASKDVVQTSMDGIDTFSSEDIRYILE